MKKLIILILCLTSFSTFAQERKGPLQFLKRIFQKQDQSKSRPPKVPASTKPTAQNSANGVVQDSLAVTMMPKFYKKHSEAVLNVALVYYGDYYTMEDLTRVQDLLEERFYAATGNTLKLKTVAKGIYPFKHQIQNYPEYTQPHVTDIDRLQRLWYYDNKGSKVMKEVWDVTKEARDIDLEDLDALLIVTGAQFEALGFASGRVVITENPMEIAWGREGGGRVEFVTDARVVDELIHEVGHAMFLDHASNQCQKPGMTYAEKLACCESSPAKDDVMSYCRNRSKVDEDFFYGFRDCNLRTIKNKIIPALLNGGEWKIADREKCD